MCVLKPRHLWNGTSIFNVSFIFCASVPGKAGQFFIFCYLGFCTLTKAAFTFSTLTLLCTYFEQSSSHLRPIHQRASPLTITPSSLLGFLNVIQTHAGLLKSHFANAQKVPVSSEVLANFYRESYLFLPPRCQVQIHVTPADSKVFGLISCTEGRMKVIKSPLNLISNDECVAALRCYKLAKSNCLLLTWYVCRALVC